MKKKTRTYEIRSIIGVIQKIKSKVVEIRHERLNRLVTYIIRVELKEPSWTKTPGNRNRRKTETETMIDKSKYEFIDHFNEINSEEVKWKEVYFAAMCPGQD